MIKGAPLFASIMVMQSLREIPIRAKICIELTGAPVASACATSAMTSSIAALHVVDIVLAALDNKKQTPDAYLLCISCKSLRNFCPPA
ncbi:hypothetical protein LMG27198_14860 [Methylocystis echinoides]|uniref:Uncharacterized protein n=1 Tax=Methylocystis echinoides TaxID=29468 RepID=A0A9W6GT83_9HYPH|nr:hypothetical protein LMG27198_14860 [Methylocystis echinoides]